MSYWSASIELVKACVAMLGDTSPRTFAITVVAAAVLAAACWWVCTNYSKLWNTRYHITALHHVLCGVAAVATLVFTVSYVSLRHTRDIAHKAVEEWRVRINADDQFRQATFNKAYHGVRALGIEDFGGYPPPPAGRRVPLRFDQSRTTLALIYTNEACRDFQRRNAFLSRILWPEAAVPRRAVEDDMRLFFQRNPGGTYMGDHAVDLATRLIRGALVPQTDRAVYLSRTTAILLFLLFQAIPFSVIGYAAYKDLKHQV